MFSETRFQDKNFDACLNMQLSLAANISPSGGLMRFKKINTVNKAIYIALLDISNKHSK